MDVNQYDIIESDYVDDIDNINNYVDSTRIIEKVKNKMNKKRQPIFKDKYKNKRYL